MRGKRRESGEDRRSPAGIVRALWILNGHQKSKVRSASLFLVRVLINCSGENL
jgi:hypothetical protein